MRGRPRSDHIHRRWTDHREAGPERVRPLPADNRALIEGRTLFPSRVFQAHEVPRLLISGANQRKIGDRVTKGSWRGMPIYTLTLEERATCPVACHNWATCMGGGMPYSRRVQAGPALEERLASELADLQRLYPRGFVVRLHILGDFYSVGYVARWRAWLDAFPALRVFGYTAWPADTEIGAAVALLALECWERFAVRVSVPDGAPAGTRQAATIWHEPTGDEDGIVCPAQTERAACCGACGLCWAPAAWHRRIVFVGHGRKVPGDGGRRA